MSHLKIISPFFGTEHTYLFWHVDCYSKYYVCPY